MAIYFLGMKTFGRARGKNGSRATSGAAYRSGERIRDERTGAVYDHRGRLDVVHKEIVLPARLAAAGAALDWARNRSALWNAAEAAERAKNARVAREFTVALPHELTAERRAALARQFAQEISDRYGSAVDLAIHAPRGDPRNFHAHLFTTTREVTPEGLGPKTTLELSGTERHRRGLPRWAEELASLRERWATLANETLKEAHIEARLEPLSRAEAMRRASTPRLPHAAYHIEQRGGHSFVAERIREKHRVASLQQGPTRTGGTLAERIRTRTRAAWAALRSRLQELRLTGNPERQMAAREPRVAAPEQVRAARPTLEQRPIHRERPIAHQQPALQKEAILRKPEGLEQRLPAPDRVSQAGPSQAAHAAESREARTLDISEVQLQSVRNWLAYREATRGAGRDLTADESARRWAEHRRSGQGMSADESREPAERQEDHGHDYDLGL